jgi:hypothetical protein
MMVVRLYPEKLVTFPESKRAAEIAGRQRQEPVYAFFCRFFVRIAKFGDLDGMEEPASLSS